MKYFFLDETKESYKFLFKWITISLITSVIGVLILQIFVHVTSIIAENITNSTLPLIVWPLVGALITGGVVYKLCIGASGEGMPSYIYGLVRKEGDLSFKVTFYKFFAALFTLSTFGNGGVIGPLGRVSAGLSVSLLKLNKKIFKSITEEDIRVSAICGMAAIVGAVFHSSIGGGVFAVEIIQKRSLHYKDLFPAILASSCAVFFSKILGLKSFYSLSTVNEFMDKDMVGWLLLFSIMIGFSGGLFTLIYKQMTKITHRSEGRILPKVIIGSLVAFGISYTINPSLLGTSQDIFIALSSGDLAGIIGNIEGFAPTTILLLIIILAKMLSNFITVGSGMSAGLTGPSALVGMLLGVTVANFLGVELSSPTYFAFVAAGFSGMLSSSMNIPLAAAILSIEIFGLQYSFPATISSIIGFQMMRGSTIYDFVYLRGENNAVHKGND